MTRKSRREIERALERIDPRADPPGPTEIVIDEYVVSTGWGEDGDAEDAGEEIHESRTRMWCDDAGEWHSEEVDVDA